MRDANSVISEAVNGYTKELAAEMEVSLPRMYELLSKDCSYPKTKRLIRKIGRVNPEGVKLIKADMDALFASILGDPKATIAKFHKEHSEATQAVLEGRPILEQKREIRQAVVAGTDLLAALDKPSLAPPAEVAKFEAHQNGGKR